LQDHTWGMPRIADATDVRRLAHSESEYVRAHTFSLYDTDQCKASFHIEPGQAVAFWWVSNYGLRKGRYPVTFPDRIVISSPLGRFIYTGQKLDAHFYEYGGLGVLSFGPTAIECLDDLDEPA